MRRNVIHADWILLEPKTRTLKDNLEILTPPLPPPPPPSALSTLLCGVQSAPLYNFQITPRVNSTCDSRSNGKNSTANRTFFRRWLGNQSKHERTRRTVKISSWMRDSATDFAHLLLPYSATTSGKYSGKRKGKSCPVV